ncbi:sucrase ferredoxin [Hassallia byssoidea VB512170]|uniref:Sucrase ferredoxin n=1 Tax=Hassallia byssoidea VB512170 TaxID=1304833 RepID=A0A846HI76_9CYAN|nr:sucrase ferredoxin [Hassalia byssoidea]NEU76131.1 sucrase ferredoxin [Hassalia byssoidea VB512170]
MIMQDSLSNCRFCCVVSKANGEDPIGSAPTYEHWLALEMGLPWTEKRFQQNPVLRRAIALIEKLIFEHGIKIRGQLLVPDSEYSRPDYTRVLYYRQPAKLFAKFEKHEFIIPDSEVGSFVMALLETLLHSPTVLPDWEQYRQQTSQIRELMVCTDGNVDVACARFGYPIYRKLRSEFAVASSGQLRVWRCSHFGGHQFAPTLIDLPYGHYWGHLQPEILELLVWRNGSVKGLYPFYRGWAGLSKFEQIVEREIWMQEGWEWLNYHKSGQVMAMDEVNQDSANIRIDFTTTDGSMRSAYEARVELSGFVMTAWNSADEQPLEEVKQYRVSRLVKVT